MILALALLLCCLLLLALAAAVAGLWPGHGVGAGQTPAPGRPAGSRLAAVVHGGSALVAAGFLGLGVAVLALGDTPALLLPVGPPWAPLSLALDGLSAWFLALLGLGGLAASGFALLRDQAAPRSRLVAYPLLLGSMALTLLAADGFTLLLGFQAMALAAWALLLAGHAEPALRLQAQVAARLQLGFALFAAACLLPAIGLLAGLAGDLSFAALRAAPPQGWQAAGVLALVMLGGAAQAALVPLHGWLPVALPAAPAHVAALLSAVATKVALYVMARLLLDLGGPAQPLGWGVPLLLAGAASAVFGALRSTQEAEARSLLGCSAIQHSGLIAMAFGLAACLRAADLGALAAVAAGAGLLHALAHTLFQTLLVLAAGEIAHSAGSRHLDRLGGLIHAMPALALAMLAGCAAAAALPPLSGFAGEWLLLQALLAAWRVGEIGFQVLLAACVAAAGLAAALGAAAMLRFWGLVFLGRPRTPRTLGAQEAPLPLRLLFFALAGLGGAIGLLPGPLLQLAAPALQRVAGHAGPPGLGLWSVSVTEAASDYQPIGLALLLAFGFLALVALLRQVSPRASVRGPAWDGGFVAPPPHLPFGDPTTQPTAAGFAQPLRRMLGTRLLAAHEAVRRPPPGDPAPARLESGFHDPVLPALLDPLLRARDALTRQAERLRDLSIRQGLGLGFGLLLALLALLAWLGSAR